MPFIPRNNSFICLYCGEYNPPAKATCRNHCRKCLCSQHLDLEFPGDRKSTCTGKMSLKEVLPGNRKTTYVLLHVCETCGKERKNRMADDDNFEKILSFMEKLQKGI